MRPDIHPHADPDQQTLLPQGKSLPCPEAPRWGRAGGHHAALAGRWHQCPSGNLVLVVATDTHTCVRHRQWQDSAGVRTGQDNRQHRLHHCAHRRPDGCQKHAGRLCVHSSAWRVRVAAWTSHAGVVSAPISITHPHHAMLRPSNDALVLGPVDLFSAMSLHGLTAFRMLPFGRCIVK